MKYLALVAAVCLLMVPSVALAQQISPHPNPYGNTITVDTAGYYNSHFQFENFGTIEIESGGSLGNREGTIYNSHYGGIRVGVGGTLNNSGRIVNYMTGTLFNSGVVNNNNSITIQADDDWRDNIVTNVGVVNNNGIIDIYQNGVLENQGGGVLINNQFLWNRQEGFVYNTNNATLINNYEFSNQGSFRNGTTSTFENNGEFDNTNGTFTNYGTFTGDGTFVGTFDSGGVLAPGNSAGVMTFTADLRKTAGSTEIELGGLFDGGGDKSLTEYDWIDVSGDVVLGGTLDVMLIDTFSLSSDMSFDFLRVAGTLSGQYDGLGEGDLVGNFGGQDLFITYAGGDGNDVALFTNAVPEPTTMLIWSMLAGLGMTVRRRR